MRIFLVLLASTSLAACGGAGVQTVGSVAPASASATAAGASSSSTPASAHTFVNPTEVKTYAAIGSVHSYKYTTTDRDSDPVTLGRQSGDQQYQQLYAGDASTARNSGTSVTYNPRDAIFDLVVKQGPALVDNTLRFQDPAHRTAFGGASQPQGGVPDIAAMGVNFLQVGKASGLGTYDPAQSTTIPVGSDGYSVDTSTFFYQKPGTTTSYVTFAGFVRNATKVVLFVPTDGSQSYLEQFNTLERGAFAYGERTASSAIPKLGTGTFTGQMVASLVFNNLLDSDPRTPTYFQWMAGTSSTTVDFAANKFNLTLTGKVTAPMFDVYTSRIFTLKEGATFNASGAGTNDIINAGGFFGQFSSAYFTQPDSTRLNLNIAGSSIDGTFFGPVAQEVGGGFRIVGGTPDERIDILGAFTGKK